MALNCAHYDGYTHRCLRPRLCKQAPKVPILWHELVCANVTEDSTQLDGTHKTDESLSHIA
jgi:hypothetical protein